ncbi:MAG: hypothetical protein A2568_01350 [Candidatus Yanofskybacteria bacterium RIFOXYD1_FULL_44_17]|uniref:Uncharacterized protein n=1 Tax=Candidatus Yanofskybacteria bacterium GW2011_GWE2_40_11 TaxID=1619033 RepID=A0A0G0SXW6_9BACT|nr:MAG: hypothetical protein UT69_C0032G0003 [Candidatus Yanofskybacteria bacterium GW2011_GWE1_40_10]KKR39645.1 MAG: hypothetical protein UT75_C0016G0003 [Candidatus Yanofskybacteria bacterium GW2011_GWE2_40_11]OGN35610.1 MAG: hypothetical protein A2207_03780 [Candidatus Yanofskybacteria bacterium RIFOXYA1_FULL_44_17]OGN37038.1 MAG: hypothetical protein A2371_02605 [Candidatus Yanofskybacteria bacterium RIFOXYB1_FULL_44_29]OGN39068.1 MAG: hypothetical protein A2405_01945 [Candidatus Yanofskyba
MKLLEEIRRQPEHIRGTMFALSVISVFSIVGLIWYQSLEKNLYTMLNPVDQANPDQNKYAQNNDSSLLGDIGGSLKGFGANIIGLIGIDEEEASSIVDVRSDADGRAYLLPLSEDK